MKGMEALTEWAKRTMRMRDDEGRPLGESKVPPEQRHGVAFDLRSCPFADSRHNNERPMNASALKQMLAHWEGALGTIALLRSLYCAEAKQERLRLIDVWRLGGLTSSIADFAFLRAWSPLGDGDLPAAVAVAYKAPLGIASTTAAMWADGAARFDAIVEADALYEYADRRGHFIGPEQVCAGPVAMVKEVLRLVVDGGGPQGRPSVAAAVIADSGRFMQFSHGAASLRLVRMALDRLDASMGFALAGALADDPATPRLSDAVKRSIRMARFLGFDAGAREAILDELLGHAADFLEGVEGLRDHTRTISEAWARPLGDAAAPIRRIVAASPRARLLRAQTREAIGQHFARFCAVEQGFAALVRLLKRHIAAALGIEPTSARAAELHLVDYVPSGIRLTRAILRDVLAIEVGVGAQ